jgi:hypothetical protein
VKTPFKLILIIEYSTMLKWPWKVLSDISLSVKNNLRFRSLQKTTSRENPHVELAAIVVCVQLEGHVRHLHKCRHLCRNTQLLQNMHLFLLVWISYCNHKMFTIGWFIRERFRSSAVLWYRWFLVRRRFLCFVKLFSVVKPWVVPLRTREWSFSCYFSWQHFWLHTICM